MTKRVSLYFEPYAWERLNRYLSYLPLSGKPFYELPTMNDLVEGMVVYVSRLMPGLAISADDLIPYIAGNQSLPPKDKMIASAYEKGRIAFNMTPKTDEALKRIRETNRRYVEKEDIGELLIPEDATDPILIRACVYYLIMEPSVEFLTDLYFPFLFDLRPSSLSSITMRDTEISALSEKEKNNLRKISWDEGIARTLYRDLCDELFPIVHQDEITVSQIPEKALKESTYQSRGFSFNYVQALIGFRSLMIGKTYDLSLPEILRGFSISDRVIREFSDGIGTMIKYSKNFILGKSQKTETEKKPKPS